MSVVTDLILITASFDGGGDPGDHPNVDRLNDLMQKEYTAFKFIQVDDYAGGNKHLQCDVFLCAQNHLYLPDLLRAISLIEWEWPESVQLMYKKENDEIFTCINPTTTPQ